MVASYMTSYMTCAMQNIHVGYVVSIFATLYFIALLGVIVILVQLLDMSCQYVQAIPPLCYSVYGEDIDEDEDDIVDNMPSTSFRASIEAEHVVSSTTPVLEDDNDTASTSIDTVEDEEDTDDEGEEMDAEERERLETEFSQFISYQPFGTLNHDQVYECPIMFAP